MANYYYGYTNVHTDGTVVQALADGDSVFVAQGATVGSTDSAAFTGATSNIFDVEGSIYSGNSYAISCSSGLKVSVGQNGSIDGFNGIYGTDQTYIVNAGTISTLSDACATSGSYCNVYNTGHIQSSYGRALDIVGDYESVNNSGTIDASDDIAVILRGSSESVVNSGQINGYYNGIVSYNEVAIGIQINNSGTVSGVTGPAIVTGELADTVINSGVIIGDVTLGLGDDTLDGHTGQVQGTVFGNDGADTLTGSDHANDVLDGGSGADIINGGGGIDTASYQDAAIGVAVDLIYADRDTGDAAGDTLISIENLTGSGYDDTLSGSLTANTLSGGAGIDMLFGRDGDDILLGGAGNDVLNGGLGNDRIDGGDGSDSASYTDAKGGVTIDLSHSSQVTGGAGTDTLISIENVTGSSLADKLYGSDAANTLNGYKGDDVLDGKLGSDVLIGGAGKDVFVFDTALGATNVDRVQDFIAVDDTIDLSRSIFSTLPASGALSANAFYVGTAAHDADDRIIYNASNGALFYDFDGNGAGAAVQFATLPAHLALTAADFTIIA